jgi:hypothetical protein
MQTVVLNLSDSSNGFFYTHDCRVMKRVASAKTGYTSAAKHTRSLEHINET